MSKVPYLQFFTSDWRSGTLGLPFELKGFYVDVLALMWDRQERLPNDAKQIARWLQVDPRIVARLLNDLLERKKLYEKDDVIGNRRLDQMLEQARCRGTSDKLPPELLPEVSEKLGKKKSKTSTKSNTEPRHTTSIIQNPNTPLTPQGGTQCAREPNGGSQRTADKPTIVKAGDVSWQPWVDHLLCRGERELADEAVKAKAINAPAQWPRPGIKLPIIVSKSEPQNYTDRMLGEREDAA